MSLSVNIEFQQLLSIVKQLTNEQKIALNEVIWSESIDIPVSHQQVVGERIKSAKQNPSSMIDWDEAKQKLNA